MQLENNLYGAPLLQQGLTLNASILQSLTILRLPMAELRELLVCKSYENPLLELEETSASDETEEAAEPVVVPPRKEEVEDDRFPDTELTLMDTTFSSGTGTGEDAFLALMGNEQTFTEMLAEQLGALPIDETLAQLCHFLLGCLDRKGYLAENPEELAVLLDCSLFDVMQAVYVLQSLEPAGVGARNLEECLLLQLVQSHHFSPHTIRLVKEGIHLVAKEDITGISALLRVDKDTAAALAQVIRGLNPIPAQGYNTGEKRETIVPDALVTKDDDGIHVLYNQRALPRMGLNDYYMSLLPTLPDPETKNYLRQHLGEARQILKAIEKREDTISRIIAQIVRLQPRFFEDGLHLVPMTLEMVATALDMNISTISRAIQGKYLKCVAGTVEIKSLFTGGIKSEENPAVSVVLVKCMIQACIREENPQKPLSDENIRHALAGVKIELSRRTVAKYREELGIPASSNRRQR